MIVDDVEVDGLERDAWHVWSHEEGAVSLCPLPSTTFFQYQAGKPSSSGAADAPTSAYTTTTGRRCGKPTSELLTGIANVVCFSRGTRHTSTRLPEARGMNTGIQDSQNLGWKLAIVAKGASRPLLDSYEAEKRPVAVGVLALSNARLKKIASNILADRLVRSIQADIPC